MESDIYQNEKEELNFDEERLLAIVEIYMQDLHNLFFCDGLTDYIDGNFYLGSGFDFKIIKESNQLCFMGICFNGINFVNKEDKDFNNNLVVFMEKLPSLISRIEEVLNDLYKDIINSLNEFLGIENKPIVFDNGKTSIYEIKVLLFFFKKELSSLLTLSDLIMDRIKRDLIYLKMNTLKSKEIKLDDKKPFITIEIKNDELVVSVPNISSGVLLYVNIADDKKEFNLTLVQATILFMRSVRYILDELNPLVVSNKNRINQAIYSMSK